MTYVSMGVSILNKYYLRCKCGDIILYIPSYTDMEMKMENSM